MQQFELDTFGKSHDLMSNFWNSCFDDLMSTAQRRDKDRIECKAKFQVRPPCSLANAQMSLIWCVRQAKKQFKLIAFTNQSIISYSLELKTKTL